MSAPHEPRVHTRPGEGAGAYIDLLRFAGEGARATRSPDHSAGDFFNCRAELIVLHEARVVESDAAFAVNQN